MEQRNPLSQGTQVNRFVIDRVIGYGASCLVYEAHYLDSGNHRKEIILKECYGQTAKLTKNLYDICAAFLTEFRLQKIPITDKQKSTKAQM